MRAELTAARERERVLREALTELIAIIDAAGLLNLSNGVQLGPTVWYVKASDLLEASRAALRSTSEEPKPEPPLPPQIIDLMQALKDSLKVRGWKPEDSKPAAADPEVKP